jgi:hypothetical protein
LVPSHGEKLLLRFQFDITNDDTFVVDAGDVMWDFASRGVNHFNSSVIRVKTDENAEIISGDATWAIEGGATPTPTPTSTVTPITPGPTKTPSITPTIPTVGPTTKPTDTPTPKPTLTPVPTATPRPVFGLIISGKGGRELTVNAVVNEELAPGVPFKPWIVVFSPFGPYSFVYGGGQFHLERGIKPAYGKSLMKLPKIQLPPVIDRIVPMGAYTFIGALCPVPPGMTVEEAETKAFSWYEEVIEII